MSQSESVDEVGKMEEVIKKNLTDHKWTSVVFQVLLLVEHVDDGCQQGVEESEDAHSHEELSGRGEVAVQEENFASLALTHHRPEMHLL